MASWSGTTGQAVNDTKNAGPIIDLVTTPKSEPLGVDPSTGPQQGQWYWVKYRDGEKLACVTHIGSNYVELTGTGEYEWSDRVHFDNFWEMCRREAEPEKYINERIAFYQTRTRQLMGEVKELTARLAIRTGPALAEPAAETSAIALRTSNSSAAEYKSALIHAKEKELPDLFKEIEASNSMLGQWMKAPLIPLKTQAKDLKKVIEVVNDRIFTVELYAGLIEEVVKCADGKPAPMDEKIHLMQRRIYMDEECLANYQTGGMSFRDLLQFDAWLAKPENLNRVLPYPRTIAAFRIRRQMREIETESLRDFIAFINERDIDKATFLYIRNGEQLYRLAPGIEFGEQLFPDAEKSTVLTATKVYAEKVVGVHDKLITEGEYLDRIEKYKQARKEHAQKIREWKKLPKDERGLSPWLSHDNPEERWVLFSPATVYHDDIAGFIQKLIKDHNRLITILQGLLDRSPVLQPHPSVSLWTPEGFRIIEFVYDNSRAIAPGDKPDFEAYRAYLNHSLKAGSITVGQEDAWALKEGEKESNRRDRSYRYDRVDYRPTRYYPYGNPGPGILSRVTTFHPKSKRCTFTWERKRMQTQRNWWKESSPTIKTSFTCAASEVLNVDAYRPGDFKIFFNDPRTRAEYLQWAPLLLEAEEWHAGNRKLGVPRKGNRW